MSAHGISEGNQNHEGIFRDTTASSQWSCAAHGTESIMGQQPTVSVARSCADRKNIQNHGNDISNGDGHERMITRDDENKVTALNDRTNNMLIPPGVRGMWHKVGLDDTSSLPPPRDAVVTHHKTSESGRPSHSGTIRTALAI